LAKVGYLIPYGYFRDSPDFLLPRILEKETESQNFSGPNLIESTDA